MPQKHTPHTTIDNTAEALANHIHAHLGGERNNRTVLIQAIEALYGSMERFNEMIYQWLDPEEIKMLGALIDEKLKEKNKDKHKFAAIFQSEIFKNVIQTLHRFQAGAASYADHSQPLSPDHSEVNNTTRTGKDDKGR